MSTTPHVPLTSAGVPPVEIDYPDSDGRPVAETPIHRDNLVNSVDILRRWFKADPQTYVSGNMFLYYVPGDRTKCVAPDVFVVRGVDRDKERRSYRVWEEEGRAPELVIEITSRSTQTEDTRDKLALYRDVLRVREYFLFDPCGEYLRPRLIGYRLSGDKYLTIEPVAGRLPSEVAGLHLESSGRELRLYDPAVKHWLPTANEGWAEAEREKLETERQRQQAERERLEAERQRQRAEREKLEAERRAIEAQAALEAKDAEIERLRRELEQQKRGD